jgi:type I restriction enzyme S subunit
LIRVRPDRARVEPRYLFWYFQTPQYWRQIASSTSGTAQPGVNATKLKSLSVPMVTLAEQRRIADILDKADAIRRKCQKAIVLTENLMHTAFQDMVGPGAKGYKNWPVTALESLAAQTPNAMRTGPFGSDLLHSEFVPEGIAVLGIDNAVQNRFAWGERRFITRAKYEQLQRYTVYPGDVIVTIMGTTGRSAVVPDDIPTAITTKHLATITLDRDAAEPEFVSQALFRHPQVLCQIAAAHRGAIMNGLNLGLIKTLRLPIPPLEQQQSFAEAARRIRRLGDRMGRNDEAEVLFQVVAARAFSGRLGHPEGTVSQRSTPPEMVRT